MLGVIKQSHKHTRETICIVRNFSKTSTPAAFAVEEKRYI